MRQLAAGDAAGPGTEHRHEPTCQERAHHLVVVVIQRRRRDADQRALLPQNRSVQGLELGAGIDALLVDERSARVVVRAERVRLPAGAVEREHELGAQSLTQRVATDECLQLGHQVRVGLDLEIGRDPVLQHAEPQVLEPVDLVLREVLELRVGERSTAPERERLSQ